MFGGAEVGECGEEADGRSQVMWWCFGKRVVSMMTAVYVLLL